MIPQHTSTQKSEMSTERKKEVERVKDILFYPQREKEISQQASKLKENEQQNEEEQILLSL